ncbi:hypothetical protein [Pseudobutyrivibrio ruminis]|nr:hypothetical protein [Pseudobutyrivibrio ruminis]
MTQMELLTTYEQGEYELYETTLAEDARVVVGEVGPNQIQYVFNNFETA